MARAARVIGAVVIAAALLAGTPAAVPTGGAAAAGSATPTGLTDAAGGVQVLTLKDDCDDVCQADTVARVAAAGCDAVRLFPTLRMASARCTSRSGRGGGGRGRVDLSRLPGVASAVPDAVVTAAAPADAAVAAPAAANGTVSWGLNRINQASLPLDGSTATPCYPSRGAGVTVYVADSGIAAGHAQFGGRASGVVAPGAPFGTPADGTGHGSHVAGIIAGATTGVAPAATLVGVRVLDANGRGRMVDVISALEYVGAIKVADAHAKVVINLSLGSSSAGARPSSEAAARAAAAGVVVVVSAGNTPISACRMHPASAADAITVAASTREDRLARFSARGACVDVTAPGVNILSVDATSQDGLSLKSGTSMAAPHAAGLAALILAEDPAGGGLAGGAVLQRMRRGAPTVGGYPLAWANPSCA